MKTETILIQKFSLSKETIKPKLFALTYYLIAVVLLVSGISKIIDPEIFLKVLNVTLGFLDESINILIATALPVIEVALGLMLMLKIKTKETLIATVLLFIVFVLFAISGFISGFDVDCGCFGENIKSQIRIWMVLRNIIFSFIVIFNFKQYKKCSSIKS